MYTLFQLDKTHDILKQKDFFVTFYSEYVYLKFVEYNGISYDKVFNTIYILQKGNAYKFITFVLSHFSNHSYHKPPLRCSKKFYNVEKNKVCSFFIRA